jgi:hypothetical protein
VAVACRSELGDDSNMESWFSTPASFPLTVLRLFAEADRLPAVR